MIRLIVKLFKIVFVLLVAIATIVVIVCVVVVVAINHIKINLNRISEFHLCFKELQYQKKTAKKQNKKTKICDRK